MRSLPSPSPRENSGVFFTKSLSLLFDLPHMSKRCFTKFVYELTQLKHIAGDLNPQPIPPGRSS